MSNNTAEHCNSFARFVFGCSPHQNQNISTFRFQFKMESDKGNKKESNNTGTGVYELPGESAILINGVPEIVAGGSNVVPSSVVETHGNLGLGEWFVGRDVQKLFTGKHYSGKVINYDKESGWYKVRYEDGDLEDLNWHELKEVLRPLDVAISLRTLAQRFIRNSKKSNNKFEKNTAGSQKPQIKSKKTKGN